MNRIIALFLAAILCLTLVSCDKGLETEQTEIQSEATQQETVELTGPWHLDSEKNDLAAFADLFPGYGEWGAGMEIRSNGQMSWYIGAEEWHGTYTVEGEVLHAQLTFDLEQTGQLWDFRITSERELEMEDNGMTIYWAYGDQEDSAG